MPTVRTTYRNGDPITLPGCDGCQVLRISGVLCHETGCPEAWRDRPTACADCGFEFMRESRYQTLCHECQ